jgi:hypothetical protein
VTRHMFRYRLRTLLIVLALGPPFLAGAWLNYNRWMILQRERESMRELEAIMAQVSYGAGSGSSIQLRGGLSRDFLSVSIQNETTD